MVWDGGGEKDHGIFMLSDKQGLLDQGCGPKNRRQWLIMWSLFSSVLSGENGGGREGGGVSCKNIWLSPRPPALYPLALPINASITPHRHAEDVRHETPTLPRWGHLPAKHRLPVVLNAISSSALLLQHWSVLSQHQPTGGSATSAGSCCSRGEGVEGWGAGGRGRQQAAVWSSTQMVEMTELSIQLGRPSGDV